MQVGLNIPMENLDTLGERVKKTRKALKLSQEQLATKSGLKQPDISKIERGEIRKPTGILGLARALRCDAYWLETGVESQPTKLPATVSQERHTPTHTIPSLEDAFNTLARHFEAMPEEDRENAVRLLSSLAHRPSSAPHLIGALMEMVVTPRKSPPEKSTGT